MIRAAAIAGVLVMLVAPARAQERDVAKLLAAYRAHPSAPVLLELAAALRETGRLADAANTYQRYLLEPDADPGRTDEIKALLTELDAQLTVLTIYVVPHDTELSLDGGPWVAVGSSLTTRVPAGEHHVRVRFHEATSELAVTGAAGQTKELSAALHVTVPADLPATAPEHVSGWLIAGEPPHAASLEHQIEVAAAPPVLEEMPSTATTFGAIAALRVDGKLRGFAGGFGLTVGHGALAAELMVLRSDVTGAYLGGRYRWMRPTVRPYGGLGMPVFAFDRTATTGESATKLALGVRVAAGVEVRITGHLAALIDLGYEHFFNVGGSAFDADVFVPTVGVEGSL